MYPKYDYVDIIQEQLPKEIYNINSIESRILGGTLNEIQNDINRLEIEVNPITMKETSIENWEKFFNLPSNSDEDLSNRKAKIIAEFIQFVNDSNVIRKDELEGIMSLFADEATVIEYFSQYQFEVILKFKSKKNYISNIDEIRSLIDKIKPSWMEFTLNVEFGDIININDEFSIYKLMYKTCGTFKLGELTLNIR